MMENVESEDVKDARVFLRERFLRFIAKISGGQPSRIVMHEKIEVTGNLRAFDLNCENIIVEKLQTPYLPVDRAIMRSSDIISIHMKNVPCESFT